MIQLILQDRQGNTERVMMRLLAAIAERVESQTLLGDQHILLVRSPQLMLDRCRLAAMIGSGQLTAYVLEAKQTLAEAESLDPDRDRHQAEWLMWQG